MRASHWHALDSIESTDSGKYLTWTFSESYLLHPLAKLAATNMIVAVDETDLNIRNHSLLRCLC